MRDQDQDGPLGLCSEVGPSSGSLVICREGVVPGEPGDEAN